ncbi:cation-transporting ATPase [Carbonactinospora thermoautotrophica]|uniref:heavy-metal-associated domain-containing protein n=1 Tax=Carbonactinospora thermoautotrophica TaxID=1469144 RepID=UPI0022720079|nr:heavy-metal-associated domain-containing protein [Carbonactinospora thermoautotrophica]MCX9193271.1 cation-transporting ATPase [Carbonactinospora thermoautotrophica]
MSETRQIDSDGRTHELVLHVEGMSCQHCVNAITQEVGKVAGVSEVQVDLAGRAVTVRGEGFTDEAIRAAIDEAGYEVVS